jgi:hypothetical protein
MVRLLNNSLGGPHGVANDKIGQVGVIQGYRTQEQGFFFCPNPQGHPTVVFNRYSRHDTLYAFKLYIKSREISTLVRPVNTSQSWIGGPSVQPIIIIM